MCDIVDISMMGRPNMRTLCIWLYKTHSIKTEILHQALGTNRFIWFQCKIQSNNQSKNFHGSGKCPKFGKAEINFHPVADTKLSHLCMCLAGHSKVQCSRCKIQAWLMKTRQLGHDLDMHISCIHTYLIIWLSENNCFLHVIQCSNDLGEFPSILRPFGVCSRADFSQQRSHLRLCLQLCKTCCIMRLGPGLPWKPSYQLP